MQHQMKASCEKPFCGGFLNTLWRMKKKKNNPQKKPKRKWMEVCSRVIKMRSFDVNMRCRGGDLQDQAEVTKSILQVIVAHRRFIRSFQRRDFTVRFAFFFYCNSVTCTILEERKVTDLRKTNFGSEKNSWKDPICLSCLVLVSLLPYF